MSKNCLDKTFDKVLNTQGKSFKTFTQKKETWEEDRQGILAVCDKLKEFLEGDDLLVWEELEHKYPEECKGFGQLGLRYRDVHAGLLFHFLGESLNFDVVPSVE